MKGTTNDSNNDDSAKKVLNFRVSRVEQESFARSESSSASRGNTTTATTIEAAHSHRRHHVRVKSGLLPVNNNQQLVLVRYFLDRPGYGLHNSACRFWINPPAECFPSQVQSFLSAQGIALDGLLVEAYLDAFESFMLLDACQAAGVVWDFADTSTKTPGILNIRLTDLYEAKEEEAMTEMSKQQCQGGGISKPSNTSNINNPPPMANTIPAGLFSFSMMVGLETAALTGELVPGFIVTRSFVLSWGPYMFFVGGVLQIIVACFQVYRNNIYGTVAFLGFGSFWLSNGLTSIIQTYKPTFWIILTTKTIQFLWRIRGDVSFELFLSCPLVAPCYNKLLS